MSGTTKRGPRPVCESCGKAATKADPKLCKSCRAVFTDFNRCFGARSDEVALMAGLIAMTLGDLCARDSDSHDRLMDACGGSIGLAGRVHDAAKYIVANAPEELGLGEGTDMYITADEAAERIFNGERVDRAGLFFVWGDEGEDTDSEDNENDG